MRIEQSPRQKLNIKRGKTINLLVNNQAVQGYEGELVSTILHELGIYRFQKKPKTGKYSGIYCGMGMCYECLVLIDGVSLRACQTPIREGMQVVTADTEGIE